MGRVDFNQEWRIVGSAKTDPVGDYAVTELRRALERITGNSPVVSSRYREGLPSIVLKYGDASDDGFTWTAEENHIEIAGENSRSLLYGVYDFLEALGCSWVRPGEKGERLPSGRVFEVSGVTVSEKAAFAGRSLIIGHAVFMMEIEDWIRWAVRNRINTLFFHTIESDMPMGAVPEEMYQRLKGTILRMTGQRGFVLEHGGHGLADLLPRSLFSTMPDAFRMKDGIRTPDHNFCVHSKAGMKIVRENAASYFEAHPEADVYHLWADDVIGGGWCECEKCKGFTASDQLLMATNAAAEELAKIKPGAEISFLAYHDTEAAPEKVKPLANVHMQWAPRLRSYADTIGDPESQVNAHYPALFKKQAEAFKKAKAKPPRIFEYYLDTFLYKSAVPPMPSVMKDDLRFYRDAGTYTVGALMTGSRPFFTAELNAWLFARLAWNPDQDLLGLIKEFCRAAYGAETPDLLSYYRNLEKAFALALDFDPVAPSPPFDRSRLFEQPPVDVGDPFYAKPEEIRARVKQNIAIGGMLAEAEKSLTAAQSKLRTMGVNQNAGIWEDERAEFEFNKLWLAFDLARLRVYDAEKSGPWDVKVLEDAEGALDALVDFCDSRIEDKRIRANTALLHRLLWGGQLARIRLEKEAKGLAGALLKLRVLNKMRKLQRGFRRKYR